MSDELSTSPMLQSIDIIKAAWKDFLGIQPQLLIANDRVLAIQQKFKDKREMTYPLTFMSVTSLSIEEALLPQKKAMRTGTGHSRAQQIGNSTTVTKPFLFPAMLQVETSTFFDDEYKALAWQERALLVMGAQKLGGTVNFNGFAFDVQQAEPVMQVPIPQREPEQVPMPDAVEVTASLTFRCKVGSTKQVAKLNNEGIITQNAYLKGTGDELINLDVLEPEPDRGEDLNLQKISRKQFQQSFRRR